MVEARVHAAADAFYRALLADDAEALYERAPCGYLSTTPDGTITQVNGTFLTWTGYQRDELVGQRRFVDLLSAGGKIYHETHYATTLQMHGAVREVALDVVTADGRRLPALVNSVLDRAEDGAPLVVRTAVFDATERRRYEQELVAAKERAEAAEANATEVARVLQQTMLPPALPTIPGLATTAAFQAAGSGTDLGGDFYDVFQLDDGEWVAVIGDVCGKGIEAAAVTALARHTIRAAAVQTDLPSEILGVVNTVLLAEPTDRYLTAVVVRLCRDDDGWETITSIAGHPLPYLRRDGSVEPYGRFGPLVGVFDTSQYSDIEGHLSEGESLVLYTDGVIEARNDAREFFGEAGLVATLEREGDGDDLARRVLDDVIAFQGGSGADDAAVLVLAPAAEP